MAQILIGTSGFTYRHWSGVFYPQDLPQSKWLEFYAQNFKTVEINASFYHQMSREVYEGWAKRTPEGFVFAVKGSRFITHIKRLKDCQEPVARFLEAASGLGKKLRVILWQLPPRWGADAERLEGFLKLAAGPVGLHPRPMSSVASLPAGTRRGAPAPATRRLHDVRYAFEFRDKSWLNPQVYGILKDYGAALVIQDSPHWPTAEVVTADFVYLRFHGRENLYGSCYNKEELGKWAAKIKRWFKSGLLVYAFFNNDAQGYAVRNAKELGELICI